MANIDDTDIVTYKSDNAARDDMVYLAYVVLPNGEYWNVRFNGPTEEIAKSKAIALWNKENAKWERLGLNKSEPEEEESEPVATQADPWASVGRGKHFAGTVWMRNAEGLKRVALTEIALYEKNGYHRSSPRGK
jgi:hypothetical protein